MVLSLNRNLAADYILLLFLNAALKKLIQLNEMHYGHHFCVQYLLYYNTLDCNDLINPDTSRDRFIMS